MKDPVDCTVDTDLDVDRYFWTIAAQHLLKGIKMLNDPLTHDIFS